jgi:hypothetical protein
MKKPHSMTLYGFLVSCVASLFPFEVDLSTVHCRDKTKPKLFILQQANRNIPVSACQGKAF